MDKLGVGANIVRMTPMPMPSAAAGSASGSQGQVRPMRSASAPIVQTGDLDLQNFDMNTPNVSAASDPANVSLDPSQASSHGSFLDEK